ncbi:MAG TPA: S-adenosylmethionine decarboxylase [Rhabdochlamydiaceae bacterium]|nr:S-adenosylmethionine decarboxylase [Rhabdochlamydiaceae bacterium]
MTILESREEIEKKADYWGYHLILDCKSCSIPKITSKENVIRFVKTLVNAIDMKAYGEPIVEHFATHDPEKGGFSLVQLIETSAITAHFVDKNGDVYLDIFSCKEFSVEICKDVVAEFFGPEKVKVIFLTRQA